MRMHFGYIIDAHLGVRQQMKYHEASFSSGVRSLQLDRNGVQSYYFHFKPKNISQLFIDKNMKNNKIRYILLFWCKLLSNVNDLGKLS